MKGSHRISTMPGTWNSILFRSDMPHGRPLRRIRCWHSSNPLSQSTVVDWTYHSAHIVMLWLGPDNLAAGLASPAFSGVCSIVSMWAGKTTYKRITLNDRPRCPHQLDGSELKARTTRTAEPSRRGAMYGPWYFPYTKNCGSTACGLSKRLPKPGRPRSSGARVRSHGSGLVSLRQSSRRTGIASFPRGFRETYIIPQGTGLPGGFPKAS